MVEGKKKTTWAINRYLDKVGIKINTIGKMTNEPTYHL